MIKICIESPYKNNMAEKIKDKQIIISKKNPDFVITYGGDGTILRAENKYPGVPKIPIRRSHVCNVCVGDFSSLGILKGKILQKKYKIKEFEKVEAVFRGEKLTGLNEIQIRSKNPRHALRISLKIGKNYFDKIIGDGLVFSTVYGSTGYYSALGYKPFKNGTKMGLNNPHNVKKQSIELKKPAEVKVLRASGLLIADNQKEIFEIKEGQTIKIRKSNEKARFVVFK